MVSVVTSWYVASMFANEWFPTFSDLRLTNGSAHKCRNYSEIERERWFSRNHEAATQKWKKWRQNWPKVVPGSAFAIDAACCFAAYSACLASIIFRMYSGISLEAANCDPKTAPLPDILPTGPFSARSTECDQSLLKLKLPKTLLDQEGKRYGMLPHLWHLVLTVEKMKKDEKKWFYTLCPRISLFLFGCK